MVAAMLQHGEKSREFYHLFAYVVMPNHVHAVIMPFKPVPLITRWLKGSTARRANLILGRTGKPFWQDESFDHWVRNKGELHRIIIYVERNPVVAGLVDQVEDWPWSSAGRGKGE